MQLGCDSPFTKNDLLKIANMQINYNEHKYLILTGIIIVAAAMRFYTLGNADIVHDEYFTALFYEERAQKITDSLIYILILVSQSYLGESELALRLPSFAFGISAIYLIFLFGRELRSTSVGLLAS